MKQNSMKRITAMLIVVLLFLSGCSAANNSDVKETTQQETTNNSTEEKATEAVSAITYPTTGKGVLTEDKVTLTGIIASVGWIVDPATNKMMNLIEEQTNVHVEWTMTTKEQLKEKLSIMVASGEVPDIIMADGLGKQDLEAYGMQGILMDLTPYIDEYAYNFKKIMAEKDGVNSYISASDGKKYFLPKIDGTYHMSYSQKYWINQSWLDALELEMPTTTDEYAEVLRAFKNNDPNGNGINDEIPVTGAIRALEDTANFLISSFIPVGGNDDSGIPTQNNYAFIIDGKPTVTADKPEFREGIRFVKGLYDEGLMDSAAFTQDRDQIKALVDGGDQNRVGGMASHHPGNFSSLADFENGRFLEFASMKPLTGPEDFASTPWMHPNDLLTGFALSAECEYPEVAVMWADFMFSDEISFMAKQGFEGEHWEKSAAGSLGLNGEAARYKVIPGPDIHQQNSIMGYLGAYYNNGFGNQVERVEGYSYDVLLYDATKINMEPYGVQTYPYVLMGLSAEDGQKFNDLRNAIHGYITESVDRFIVGDLDIEKDWDSYLQQLQDLGLQEYIELLEKYYAK